MVTDHDDCSGTQRPALRRAVLGSALFLGSVIAAVGATGVIAPVTDVALTGTESPELVRTGEFAALTDVDLKVGRNLDGGCDTVVLSDDLTLPTTRVDGVTEAWFDSLVTVCIRNDGTTPVRVGIRALPASVTFTDDECSPGETDSDPDGCTVDRLSAKIGFRLLDPAPAGCPVFDTVVGTPTVGAGGGRATTDVLPVGVTCGYHLEVFSLGGEAAPSLTPADQTDTVTWQFEFQTR